MNEYRRLKDNLDILERHNEIHTPIFYLTDGKTHEQDLIRELISDCRELLGKIENEILVELPCKIGDTATAIVDTFAYDNSIRNVKIKGLAYIVEDENGDTTFQHISRVFSNEKEAKARLKEFELKAQHIEHIFKNF